MLKHVSKHPAVAAERFRASVGLVCVIGRPVSGDINATGHAGTDAIYKENHLYPGNLQSISGVGRKIHLLRRDGSPGSK
jgi:hypothetical protein